MTPLIDYVRYGEGTCRWISMQSFRSVRRSRRRECTTESLFHQQQRWLRGRVPTDFDYAAALPALRGLERSLGGAQLLEWCAPCRHEIGVECPESCARPHRVGRRRQRRCTRRGFGARDKMGIEFPVIVPIHRHYGYELPSVLPTTVVIDPKVVSLQRWLGRRPAHRCNRCSASRPDLIPLQALSP